MHNFCPHLGSQILFLFFYSLLLFIFFLLSAPLFDSCVLYSSALPKTQKLDKKTSFKPSTPTQISIQNTFNISDSLWLSRTHEIPDYVANQSTLLLVGMFPLTGSSGVYGNLFSQMAEKAVKEVNADPVRFHLLLIS